LGLNRTQLAALAETNATSVGNLEGGYVPKAGTVAERLLDALDEAERQRALDDRAALVAWRADWEREDRARRVEEARQRSRAMGEWA
jgi:hypothetical protein